MMLEVRDLCVSYGSVQVLWDIEFHVDEGEVVALVGANAAGKTTILKSVAGLLHPSKGSITFRGTPLRALPAHRIVETGLCLIPEGRRLFPDMTVKDNLELGAYSSKVWGARHETLDEIYELFPVLRERSSQQARTLSGGEQQMVAVGRGLMSRPRLCMLDEPCLGLSPLNVRELFRIIGELRAKGTTVLVVEQNVHQTLAVSDRAYVLENGRIVLEGTGTKLLGDAHVRQAYLGL